MYIYSYIYTLDIPLAPFPPCDLAAAVRILLAAGRSAPGGDGLPYEAFQAGPWLFGRLLLQTVRAACVAPGLLPWVLGPNTDLLVWIPKKDGDSLVPTARRQERQLAP